MLKTLVFMGLFHYQSSGPVETSRKIKSIFQADFFSRNPQDIVSLIDYYHKMCQRKGVINLPSISPWTTNVPSIDDINQVLRGELYFDCRFVYDPKEKCLVPEYDRISLTYDFDFLFNSADTRGIDSLKSNILKLKRPCGSINGLYKVQFNGDSAFVPSRIVFIPEDVALAIHDHDFSTFIKTNLDSTGKRETSGN
jgi:hypothetical protein